MEEDLQENKRRLRKAVRSRLGRARADRKPASDIIALEAINDHVRIAESALFSARRAVHRLDGREG